MSYAGKKWAGKRTQGEMSGGRICQGGNVLRPVVMVSCWVCSYANAYSTLMVALQLCFGRCCFVYIRHQRMLNVAVN